MAQFPERLGVAREDLLQAQALHLDAELLEDRLPQQAAEVGGKLAHPASLQRERLAGGIVDREVDVRKVLLDGLADERGREPDRALPGREA